MNYSYIDILISAVLALIMFGIGLSLTPANFKDIFLHPKAIFVGLISKMIVLPLMAICLVWFTHISPTLKVGFVILAACPGGTTSGFITYYFKGNVALSVSLISINNILSLLTISVIVNFALRVFLGSATSFHLPFIETMIQIFCLAILPAAFGVFIRHKKTDFALRIQKPMKIIMVCLLAVVFLIKFFIGENQGGTGISGAEVVSLLPLALMINILAFLTGFYSGMIPRLGIKASFTIGMEVALQNTTLAFLVAGTLLHNEDMMKPSLIYSMFSFWTAIIFSIVVKKIYKTKIFGDFRN